MFFSLIHPLTTSNLLWSFACCTHVFISPHTLPHLHHLACFHVIPSFGNLPTLSSSVTSHHLFPQYPCFKFPRPPSLSLSLSPSIISLSLLCSISSSPSSRRWESLIFLGLLSPLPFLVTRHLNPPRQKTETERRRVCVCLLPYSASLFRFLHRCNWRMRYQLLFKCL